MHSAVSKFWIIVLCIGCLAGFVYFDCRDSIRSDKIELSFQYRDEIIHAWNEEEVYYLFLPSYSSVEEVQMTSYSVEFEVVKTGKCVKNKDYLSDLAINEKIECKSLSTGKTFFFQIMCSENLPALFMETDSGTIDAIWSDKEAEENGKLRIYDYDGKLTFKGGLSSIKARGNYSFTNYEKKPFSIKMKEEVSLLGLKAGQEYVLLANASDPTLIRNDIARRMEAALDTEYTNIGQFVDLYANGDYLGNYYLCEKIEIGKERIAVANLEEQMDLLYQKSNYASYDNYETDTKRAKYMDLNPADITGGYLVEREFEDRYRAEYVENASSFITEGKEHFIVKSPSYCSDEQIDYLERYFNEAETAILAEDGIHPVTGKAYSEYIDVDSFLKKYLIEEVTKNYDAGISSCFFYKDSDLIDGRLKAAPIWDCDMSLGNYLEWMEYFSKDPSGVSRLSLHVHACPWYDALYKKEECYTRIRAYYMDMVSPYMELLITESIDMYKEKLQASAVMNEIRWQKDFDNNVYYTDRDTSFEQLKEFTEKRKEFLDSAWIEEVPYHMVTFLKDGVIYEIRYIEENSGLGTLPEMEGADFNGWFYAEETGSISRRKADSKDLIKEDKVIICDKIESAAEKENN